MNSAKLLLIICLCVLSLKANDKTTKVKPAINSKATVAVLWVKPEFGYWIIPRSRRPGGNRKAVEKMKEFVTYVKKTGAIGVQVSDYISHHIQLSNKHESLEQVGNTKLRNKLIEYRITGWRGHEFTRAQLEFADNLGADYTLTAKITKLWESSKDAAAFLSSKGAMTGNATVEVTLTNIETGDEQVAIGAGESSESGYEVIFNYKPSQTVFDKMLLGVALKRAFADAASKLGLTQITKSDAKQVSVMPLAINLSTTIENHKLPVDISNIKFRQQLLRTFGKLCETSSKFKNIPLPRNASREVIITQKLMKATKILPAEEFAKIKSFKLPEKFIYGAVNVTVEVHKIMNQRTIIYHAETVLRLVDGKTLKYSSSTGSADSGDIDTSVNSSIVRALETLK